MSKIESGVRLVLDFNAAFNRHDVAGMMALMSDDCVFENTAPAPDGLGERCIMRWKYSWVDPEGKAGHVRGVDIFRVRDGSIREKLSYVKG
jgi:ketosteroid isomerase-like protein